MVAALNGTIGNFNPAKNIFLPGGEMDYSGYFNGGMPIGYQTPRFTPISFRRNINTFPQTVNTLNNNYQEMFVRQSLGSLTVNDALSNFQRKLINNESSNINLTWIEFKDSLKNTREYMLLEQYGMATDKNMSSLAKQKYLQLTGQSLDVDIDENTHGNFISGFINGFTFGIAQDKSGDQVREDLLGVEEPRGSAITRTIGSIAGGAAVGAATGAAIGSIVPVVGTAIGAGIGAAVGAVSGFISKLWS